MRGPSASRAGALISDSQPPGPRAIHCCLHTPPSLGHYSGQDEIRTHGCHPKFLPPENSSQGRFLTWLTGLGCWALCGGRGGLIIPQKPQATGTWLKAQPHVLCLGRGWDLGEEGGAPIAPPRWPPAFPQLGGRCCGAPRRPTCLPPHTGRRRNPRLGHEFYSTPSPHPLSHPCVLLGGKPPLR